MHVTGYVLHLFVAILGCAVNSRAYSLTKVAIASFPNKARFYKPTDKEFCGVTEVVVPFENFQDHGSCGASISEACPAYVHDLPLSFCNGCVFKLTVFSKSKLGANTNISQKSIVTDANKSTIFVKSIGAIKTGSPNRKFIPLDTDLEADVSGSTTINNTAGNEVTFFLDPRASRLICPDFCDCRGSSVADDSTPLCPNVHANTSDAFVCASSCVAATGNSNYPILEVGDDASDCFSKDVQYDGFGEACPANVKAIGKYAFLASWEVVETTGCPKVLNLVEYQDMFGGVLDAANRITCNDASQNLYDSKTGVVPDDQYSKVQCGTSESNMCPLALRNASTISFKKENECGKCKVISVLMPACPKDDWCLRTTVDVYSVVWDDIPGDRTINSTYQLPTEGLHHVITNYIMAEEEGVSVNFNQGCFGETEWYVNGAGTAIGSGPMCHSDFNTVTPHNKSDTKGIEQLVDEIVKRLKSHDIGVEVQSCKCKKEL